ncbi:YggS family pyridoxal phosphate-dependent enzyme [Amylibacter sp. SFDW26]|uniref:YggS family pyridoxal phosphate-dependent enzyme n=1 Tax=Amylibacter sp. SFDW26 TaxID=2652722 RepID=UPI00126207D3|nr:YggS family pyridoxal phosphate-dependent enzyme [Amylibacter sp. SFDW26]KAB7614473.1 YggS family pyridoxal phosphate-dependent enzyme [Amylibacter sp. SFDW26]
MSLNEIKTRILKAEETAKRPAGSTQLIAVSKVQPNERVHAVLQQGHRLFGENKVQESEGKWPDFKQEFPDAKVHLIGPLQTNKVKNAVALFDAIHAVDRPKLANKLASEIQTQGKAPDMFIQVNTGEEPQKAGILPADADAFIKECIAMELPIIGLMVIPPVNEESSLHFTLLRKIAERNGLTGLSMGMSGDFERAVALGATHVRVGSAIFGERDYG